MPNLSRTFDSPGSNMPHFNNWRLPVPPIASFLEPELTKLEIECPTDLRRYICGLISLIYEPNIWEGGYSDRKALSEYAQNYVKGCDDMPPSCDIVYECMVGDSRIQDLLQELIEKWSVQNWSLPDEDLEAMTATEQLDCLWTASEAYVDYIFDEISQIALRLQSTADALVGIAGLFPLLDTALQATVAGAISNLAGAGASLIQQTSDDQDARRKAACQLFTLLRCNREFPWTLEKDDHKAWAGQLISQLIDLGTDDQVTALFGIVLGVDASVEFIELISFSQATLSFIDGLNDCDDGWAQCGDCPNPAEFPTMRIRPNSALGLAGDPSALAGCPPDPTGVGCAGSPEECRQRYTVTGISQYAPQYIGNGQIKGQGIQMVAYVASPYAPSPACECVSVNLGGFFNQAEFRIYVSYVGGGVEMVHQAIVRAGPQTITIGRPDVETVIFWTLNSQFDVTQDSWRVQCAGNILEDAECWEGGTIGGAFSERRVVC